MTISISIDVEASGPVPGKGDMISFGAIVVEPGLNRFFESHNMLPECALYSEEAYQSIGMTRSEHLAAEYTIEERMLAFQQWLKSLGERPVMVSDNPAFDFMWINYEGWHKCNCALLGHSARRIGDMWAGIKGNYRDTQSWKRLRRTAHDHKPLNDARGNAEALLEIWK